MASNERTRSKTSFSRLLAPLLIVVVNVGIITTVSLASSNNVYFSQVTGPYLSWSNDAGIFNLSASSITISWRSKTPEVGIVEYGTDPDQLTSRVENATPALQHVFVLTGLDENTTYYYRVGNSHAHSPTFHFTTMERDPDTIRFCVYGDTRPPDSRNAEVVALMAERDPQFWLHVGDLVGAGGNMDQWLQYLNELDGLAERSSFMPVIGNHEYYGEPSGQPETFYELFELPGDESTYAFEVGDVLFVAINTREDGTWSDGHAVDPEELEWVNQTLAQHYLDYKWIMLYAHYPPYSSNGMATAVRNDLIPIAERYDIDVFFTGHVHNYERFDVPNSIVNGSTIPYFVTGGGGAPLSRLAQPINYSKAYYSVYEYMYCEVNDTHVYMETVNIQGEQIDNLTISLKDRTNLSSYW